MVKNVEEFGAELQVEPLGDVGVFHRGEIQLLEPRSDKRVAPHIAVGSVDGGAHSDRWGDEGVGVEPLADRVRIEVAGEVRVPTGTDRIARVTVAGRVITELRREREAGLDGDDGAGGPAADEVARRA